LRKVRRSYGFVALLAAAAPSQCDPAPAPAITVQCSPLNDFGYIASASGALQFGSRLPDGKFTVNGTLTTNTRLFGDPDRIRNVTIAGTVDQYGSSMFADVLSGADDLVSVFANFQNSPGGSHVLATNTTEYQTACTGSVVQMPAVADLKLDGALRGVAGGRVQIDVTNIGTVAVTGGSIKIRVGTTNAVGSLHAKAGHPTAPANTLNPGYAGYIEAPLSLAIGRCQTHNVLIDTDRTVQSGSFDPFTNDSGPLSTPCLRWDTVITAETLGITPDPLLSFKTLGQIVNSQVVARSDGNRCNVCHNAGSSRPYRPSAGTITPSTVINGRSWAGFDGWATQFQSAPSKPTYLKDAFRRWLDDGGQ
jgi:hypothetical protein